MKLVTKLVEAWDQQFPSASTSFTPDLEAAELLADFNRLIRRARERLAQAR